MRRKIEIIISFAIGIFFLYIAFREINLKDLWASFSGINWAYIVVIAFMSLVSIAIRGWRWKILLSPIKVVSYQRVFNFTMIGFMANNLLPAHMGEIVRAYLLGEKENISKISTFITVVVERLFDFAILTFFLLITLVYITIPDWLKYGGLVIGVSSFVLIFLIFLLVNNPSKDKIISKFLARLPEKLSEKLSKKITSFFDGLKILKEKNLTLQIFALSILVWIHILITVGFTLLVFDFEINLILISIFLMVLLAFSITIPSTPGYFGNMQIAFIIGLGLAGISKAEALACSFVFHFTQYIPVTVAGILLFIKEGISFRSFMEKIKKEKQAEKG